MFVYYVLLALGSALCNTTLHANARASEKLDCDLHTHVAHSREYNALIIFKFQPRHIVRHRHGHTPYTSTVPYPIIIITSLTFLVQLQLRLHILRGECDADLDAARNAAGHDALQAATAGTAGRCRSAARLLHPRTAREGIVGGRLFRIHAVGKGVGLGWRMRARGVVGLEWLNRDTINEIYSKREDLFSCRG